MIKGKGATSFPGVELDYCGVYRITKDGKLSLLTNEMSKPNGITFSPDEKTLYVSTSDPEHAVWMAFPVKPDGTLGKGKQFFDATASVGKLKGLPDGMKTDKDGNLFAAGPGGILVFTPAAEHLGTRRHTGVPTANCNWGRRPERCSTSRRTKQSAGSRRKREVTRLVVVLLERAFSPLTARTHVNDEVPGEYRELGARRSRRPSKRACEFVFHV